MLASDSSEVMHETVVSPKTTVTMSSSRSIAWDTAFEKGLFSDITVSALSKTFRLHKVVLQQSPYFSRLLLGGAEGEAMVVDDYLNLEVAGDPRITKESLEIALWDLYTCSSEHRKARINPSNILYVLATACFFELTDLIEYCNEEALASLSRQTILHYTIDLDKIRPPQDLSKSRNEQEYFRLLKIYHSSIQSAVLSYLCQLINVTLSEASSGVDRSSGRLEGGQVDTLFEDMPVRWLKRVIECDALCIVDEFERYELLKCIALERRRASRKKRPADNGQMDGSKSGVSRLFGSYMAFGGMVGAKKAKLSDGSSDNSSPSRDASSSAKDIYSTPQKATLESRVNGPGLINLYGIHDSARSEAEEQEDSVIMSIFQNSIIYTYMTFAQLEKVKADRIVPDSSVLQSFWMQAELTSRFASPNPASRQPAILPTLRPFRFAAHFKDVRAFFNLDSPNAAAAPRKMMVSESIKCAGVDYRVLLGLSDDENHSATSSSSTLEQLGKPPSGKARDAEDKSTDDDISMRRLTLKAHLQRNRNSGANAGSAASTAVSYSIYVFDVASFSEGGDRWKQFHKPLTACDFDGNGFVKGFPLPPAVKDKRSNLWLIVNINLVKE
ncbi:hypothetical protein HDV05_003926 [Chytridiales sp. JEL 0842]|nr:hypothetical protein HDV05_003926 [Chytridiales sp. JEL 0842]